MTGACFSPCRRYRYRLWRTRIVGDGTVCFVLLNPSTADEIANDPTVERCWRRAKQWGYIRMDVVNIFGLRSTDPAALYAEEDPIGPWNTDAILAATSDADTVICGWGEHGRHLMRGKLVEEKLRQAGITLLVLGMNKSGQPKHPLYLSYATETEVWI